MVPAAGTNALCCNPGAAGNRVTVRDWYQLTLKEGLTRFRDQAFAADYDAAASAAAAVCGPLVSTSDSSSSAYSERFEAALLQNIASMAEHMKTAAAAAPAGAAPAALAAAQATASDTTSAACVVGGPAFPCSWHRVLEARGIRGDQMPEDEGCLSHPIRPCCSTSLDNIYTDTVYDKVRHSSSSSSSSSGISIGIAAGVISNQ
jgi:aminopeptidase N